MRPVQRFRRALRRASRLTTNGLVALIAASGIVASTPTPVRSVSPQAYAGQIIGYRANGAPIRLLMGGAGPVVVQTATSVAAYQGSPVTITFSSGTTAGNCIVVGAALSDSGSTAYTISGVTLGGAAGNFAQVFSGGASSTAVDNGVVVWWVDPNCAGSQTAVAVTITSTTNSVVTLFAYEVSGMPNTLTGMFDAHSSGFASSGTSYSSGASGTTAQGSEIAFGLVSAFNATTAITLTGPGGSWVNAPQKTFNYTGTAENSAMSGYQILTSTGTVTYTVTSVTASAGWAAGVITLRAAVSQSITGVGASVPVAGGVGTAIGTSPPPPPPAFPTNPLNISVQLLLNGTWTDISSWVYLRDDISITGRGRPDWSQTLQPSSCTITINNIGGNFSPSNVSGLFYPYIARNTQIRVSVSASSVGATIYTGYRFWGEVSDWPPNWDVTGTDVTVPITASGVMRRYIQGGLIGSPLKRFYQLKTDATTPVALWTMEDLSGSTQFANQIINADSMTWTGGPPTLAADSTSFQGADPLPLISMATITGNTGSYSASGVAEFNTPGTFFWTAPGTITAPVVTMWGGGTGGNNFTSAPAGGTSGAGGEYASYTAAVTPGTTYTVVVGAGGQPGVGSSPQSGSNGGDSSFTDNSGTKTAHGAIGPVGGTGSTASTHFDGGAGAAGGSGTSGGGTTTHTQAWNAVHTYSYEGLNNDSSPAPGFTPGALINTDGNALQGDDQLGDNGNTSCIILLPYATIHAALSGYSGINFAKLTLHCLHSWYNSGMTVAIGSSNYTGSFAVSRNISAWQCAVDNFEPGIAAGQTSTWTLPTFYLPPLASVITAFLLRHVASDRNFYGYFSGGTAPSLQMQWTTGSPSNTTGSGGGGGASGGSAGTGAAGAAGTALSGGQGGFGGSDPDGSGGQGGSFPANGQAGQAPGGGGGGGSYGSPSGGQGASGQVIITYAASSTPNNVVTRFALSVPVTGAVNGASLVRSNISSGSLTYVECYYGTGGFLGFRGYNGASLKFDSGLLAFACNGVPMMVSMELATSGANIAWQIRAVVPGGSSYVDSVNGTYTTATIGAVSSVTINANGTINDTCVGIVVVQYALEDMITSGLASYLAGHTGELAGDRFTRLCTEENISGVLRGLNTDTPLMGPQRNMTFTAILQSIEDADQGMLIEARDMLGLYYRTRANLENQVNPVIYDYSLAQFSTELLPVDDDQLTRNDVTVSRINGVSTNTTLPVGALSIQAPPNGVGDYTYSIDANLFTDSQVTPMAAWLLSEGTAGGQRYENIEVNLTRPELSALFAAVPGMDCGDFFQIINTPAWIPPGPANQLAWGFEENLNNIKWQFIWSSVPQLAYTTDFLGTGASGSADNSSFVTSLGTWVGDTNCNVALATGVGHSGSNSLQMTSQGAGQMLADHCPPANYATQALKVIPGEQIYVSGYFQAAVHPRQVPMYVLFLTSAGAGISYLTGTGTAPTDNTTGWTQSSCSVIAPATAAWAIAVPDVLACAAANEVHYADDIHMIGGWW